MLDLHLNLYSRREEPEHDLDVWCIGVTELLRVLDGEPAQELYVAGYGEKPNGQIDTSQTRLSLTPEEVAALTSLTPMQRQALAKLDKAAVDLAFTAGQRMIGGVLLPNERAPNAHRAPLVEQRFDKFRTSRPITPQEAELFSEMNAFVQASVKSPTDPTTT